MNGFRFLKLFLVLVLAFSMFSTSCLPSIPGRSPSPFTPPTAFPEDFTERPVSGIEYYDNSPALVVQAEINKIMDAVTRVWVKLASVRFVGGEKKERIRWVTAVGIFDGSYIRTVAHLFKKDLEVKEIYFIDREKGRVDLEIVSLDRTKDAALLKMPDGIYRPMPTKIGDSSKIAYGDWLFIVTNVRFHSSLKYGIVSTPQPICIEEAEIDAMHVFWITAANLTVGDSGAAIFAIKAETGKLELVGMISGALYRGRGGNVILIKAVKIN